MVITIWSCKNKRRRGFIGLVTFLIILSELISSVFLFLITEVKADPNLEQLKIKEIELGKYAFKSLNGDVIEIGTEKHSPPQPYLKLEKWDGEVSFKIDIPYGKEATETLNNNKLTYSNHKYDIQFYPREPEEIEEEIAGELHSFKQNEQGGVEFDTILYEKPESNIFEFSIETKGLKFYYQPPLHPDHPTWADTDGDGIADSFRPENVVGSYAVYHETQDKFFKTKEEAEKYKTGIAFHIYRPKVKDSSGKEIWGELNIDEQKGTLTITIDQSWLDNAVYPVNIDPNFGYETIGGTTYRIAYKSGSGPPAIACDRRGTAWNIPEAGTADSISAYTSGDGAVDMTVAINEKDSEGANSHGEIAKKENLAVSGTAGWKTFTLASESLSSGVDYILDIIGDGNDFVWEDFVYKYAYVYGNADGITSYYEGYSSTYTVENPWTVSPEATAVKYSIYCTYSPTKMVEVSAAVLESLSFSIEGVTNANCDTTFGTFDGPNSTATSVPYGLLSSLDTFHHACQDLTVSTNAGGGYSTTVHETTNLRDDSIPANIPDSQGDNSVMSETTTDTWATATYNGFAYTCADISGSDCDMTATTLYRQFACLGTGDECDPGEGSETAQIVMQNSGTVSNNKSRIQYKVSISITQAAGSYSNTIVYITTPTY